MTSPSKTNHLIRVIREVSYLEALDLVVVAGSLDEAVEVAEGIAKGEQPHWPNIDSYVVVERQPLDYEMVEIKVDGGAEHTTE